MSAVLEAREPSARYLEAVQPAVVRHFELLATATGGVARLREFILSLAVQGKLTAQDCDEEPASALLERIQDRKLRSIASGAIKQGKKPAELNDAEPMFELPKGWTWTRLGELCSYIQRGKGPAYAEQSEHKVISQKCVRWYGLDLAPARFVTAESLAKYEPVRFLRAGDLLWNSTGTGTIGRACVVPIELDDARLVADSHVTVVRPLEVNSVFLWRWIQSPFVQNEIEGSASGTTNQIELNTSTVLNQPVPLPPLAEQARIVDRVDELMRLCDSLEAKGLLEAEQHARLLGTLLGTLTDSSTPEELATNWQRVADHFDLLLDRPEAVDALEQTILQLAVRGQLMPHISVELEPKSTEGLDAAVDDEPPFDIPTTWRWCRFADVLDFQGGSQPPKSNFSESPRDGYVRLIQIRDLGDKPQPVFVAKSLVSKFCSTEDIMVGRYGASVGKVFWGIEGAYNVALVKIIDLHGSFDRRFLYLLLSSPFGQSWFRGISRSAQDGFNKNDIGPNWTPVPPLAEQAEIVARVDELRRLCADLRHRLERCGATQGALADSLIDQARTA